MFFEPMLRFLVVPALFLLLTFLYPLFGRLYKRFASKSLRKRKDKVADLKQTREAMQKEVNKSSEDSTSELESALVSVSELEAKERVKITALRISLLFNKFFTWVSRITAIVLLSFGWTFTVATIGASAAVMYVAVMASVDCDPSGVDTVSAETPKSEETKSSSTTTTTTDNKSETTTSETKTTSSSKDVKSSSNNNYGFGDLTEEVKDWAKGYSGFTFVGDSLGVGVEPKLKGYFPNSTYDSKVSRAFENSDSTLSGIETVKKLESEKKVKEVLVVALGTNQTPTNELMDKLVKEAKSAKTIIWVTTASEGGSGSYNKIEHDKIAEVIKAYVADKSNMTYLDWNAYVQEKSKWSDLTSDSVHMNDKGYELYSKFLTRGIYDVLKGGSKDNLVTKAIKRVKCKPKKHKQATSSKKESSSLSSVDGQDNPPSDAFTSWGWRPEDLPEGLKPYIIDPKNYGMDFGLPGTGWFQYPADPSINGQCVALTISLGNHIWGRPQESVQGHGALQAGAWANIFGNRTTNTPRRGAIFSDMEHPTYGHTGIVCTVFKDGTLLTIEQNTSLAGWDYRGEQYVWYYRIYREEQWKGLGMEFAYDDSKTPILK